MRDGGGRLKWAVQRADGDGEPYGSLLGVVWGWDPLDAHDEAARVLGESWGPLAVTLLAQYREASR